jgi:hypothetical protein
VAAVSVNFLMKISIKFLQISLKITKNVLDAVVGGFRGRRLLRSESWLLQQDAHARACAAGTRRECGCG